MPSSIKLSPLFFLASLLSIFSACASPSGDNQVKAVSIQDPGQAIFLNNCASCHMGAGDPPGPNEVIIKSKKLASQEAFKAYLRNPDNNMMPPFSEAMVSDADVDILYAYLAKQK